MFTFPTIFRLEYQATTCGLPISLFNKTGARYDFCLPTFWWTCILFTPEEIYAVQHEISSLNALEYKIHCQVETSKKKFRTLSFNILWGSPHPGDFIFSDSIYVYKNGFVCGICHLHLYSPFFMCNSTWTRLHGTGDWWRPYWQCAMYTIGSKTTLPSMILPLKNPSQLHSSKK
jgi:hypothetical protein